jgi:hypothetical protein
LLVPVPEQLHIHTGYLRQRRATTDAGHRNWIVREGVDIRVQKEFPPERNICRYQDH